MKKLIVLFLLSIIMIISGCGKKQTVVDLPKDEVGSISVHPLTYKFDFVYSLYTLYEEYVLDKKNSINVLQDEKCPQLAKNYYLVMNNAWQELTQDEKQTLETLFDKKNIWAYEDALKDLDDGKNVTKIVERVQGISKLDKSRLEKLFSHFDEFYYQWFKKVNSEKQREIESMNNQYKGFNLVDFYRKYSGIDYPQVKYEFYLTSRTIGALGFALNNTRISTIQINVGKEMLLYTPFHENSHEILRPLKDKMIFKYYSYKLRKNKKLKEFYNNNGMMHSYDWNGWIEENLVEGFAKYLRYMYNGTDEKSPLYVYDLDFKNYLIENYNPQKQTILDASRDYLRSLVE